ncbi:Rhodanese-like domain [Trinorchestia longiramus]|nr:Rhodanese-like domain [Trinorchestia longiramus]
MGVFGGGRSVTAHEAHSKATIEIKHWRPHVLDLDSTLRPLWGGGGRPRCHFPHPKLGNSNATKMPTVFLILLLYAGASVTAAPNSPTASAEEAVLSEALYDSPTTRTVDPRPEGEIFRGLFPEDADLRVRNIEGVTGAVLVKSRIIDKSEAKEGKSKAAQGKSLFRSIIPKEEILDHWGKPNRRTQSSSPGNQTQILLTFLQPVNERGKNSFLNQATTKFPSLMKIVAGESDFQVEYLETGETAPLSLFRGSGIKKKFQDSLESSSKPKFKIPGRVPTPSEKLASFQITKHENDDDWFLSKLAENDGLDDILESGLIKVKGQPLPQDDPDLIHLAQTIQEIITVTRSLPSVAKTVTNTITETRTHADRRPISEVITQVLTITSVTVTTTTKTETSIAPTSPTTTVETKTMPPMQRPTKGTFLSPMPPRTSSTTATSSTSIRSTSVVEPSTETSLLDPTDPDFSVPLNLRERGSDSDEPNDEQMGDGSPHSINVQGNITQIMMLKDQAQNGGSVNQTKVLLFTILKNMTNMTDTRIQTLNEILKTPEDITFFLETLVRRIAEITNQTLEMIKNDGNEDGGFAPVIRNTEDKLEEESIIPQDAINTNVDVWPNGRRSNNKFVANFAPTIVDPFHCRKKGIEYPIMHEVYQAFKLQSSSFQTKFGFPKPKPSSPIVTLTGGADGRAVEAWNELQKFGYCNVKLYLGSYLDYVENGGTLVPYFLPAEDEQTTNLSDLDNREITSPQRNFRFSVAALDDEHKHSEVLMQTSVPSRTSSMDVDYKVLTKQKVQFPERDSRTGRTLSSRHLDEELKTEEEQRGVDNMNNQVESDAKFQEKLQNNTENVGENSLSSSDIMLSSEAAEDKLRNEEQDSEIMVDVSSLSDDFNPATAMTSVIGNDSNPITETSLTETQAEKLPAITEGAPQIYVQSSENSSIETVRLDDDSHSAGQHTQLGGVVSRTNAHQQVPAIKATNLTTTTVTNTR